MRERCDGREIKAAGYYDKVWQSFAVLLPVKTVGVVGDERSYENVIALRVVDSQDGMTANWVALPFNLLGRISNRILNEVRGVNRVVYDISSKPPATIEWEYVFKIFPESLSLEGRRLRDKVTDDAKITRSWPSKVGESRPARPRSRASWQGRSSAWKS